MDPDIRRMLQDKSSLLLTMMSRLPGALYPDVDNPAEYRKVSLELRKNLVQFLDILSNLTPEDDDEDSFEEE